MTCRERSSSGLVDPVRLDQLVRQGGEAVVGSVARMERDVLIPQDRRDDGPGSPRALQPAPLARHLRERDRLVAEDADHRIVRRGGLQHDPLCGRNQPTRDAEVPVPRMDRRGPRGPVLLADDLLEDDQGEVGRIHAGEPLGPRVEVPSHEPLETVSCRLLLFTQLVGGDVLTVPAISNPAAAEGDGGGEEHSGGEDRGKAERDHRGQARGGPAVEHPGHGLGVSGPRDADLPAEEHEAPDREDDEERDEKGTGQGTEHGTPQV